jgi:bifunctional DNA-binding transcriptional regulator/antitoxin component of YhaV-PrlF toxin-antitoxin module
MGFNDLWWVCLSVSELDSRGRVTIPKVIRDQMEMEKRVLVINAGDHVKLVPLPSDPLKLLHGGFKTEKTFQELRREAESLARENSKEG